MARLSKDVLLGASDLREEEVELESIGGSVLVRGLPAAFSNQAQSEALEMKTVGNDQVAKVNTAKLEAIQIQHGLVDPKLDSLQEAEQWMQNCGPSVRKAVDKIDALSGVDKEAIADTTARFPGGDESEAGGNVDDGAAAGGSGPDIPARTGA